MNRIFYGALMICVHVSAFPQEIPQKAIQSQHSDQESCIAQKLQQCEEKCMNLENSSLHCHGLCKLNITNECRYAGE